MNILGFFTFGHLRKSEFPDMNLKIMKINNEVNLLNCYFLMIRNKTPNINMSYNYADLM